MDKQIGAGDKLTWAINLCGWQIGKGDKLAGAKSKHWWQIYMDILSQKANWLWQQIAMRDIIASARYGPSDTMAHATHRRGWQIGTGNILARVIDWHGPQICAGDKLTWTTNWRWWQIGKGKKLTRVTNRHGRHICRGDILALATYWHGQHIATGGKLARVATWYEQQICTDILLSPNKHALSTVARTSNFSRQTLNAKR